MNRDFLIYLTTFISGGAIMSVELTASRFLAPYYGSSMVVWSVLIGIVLVALSLGNFMGGVIADREEGKKKLYSFILYSGIWIGLIPFIGKYLIALIFLIAAKIFPSQVIFFGSMISSAALFAFPCILLGTVSPGLVKLVTSDLDSNGRRAGELFALSTIGSFIGAMLPTFVFVPFLGTSRTFMCISIVLIFLYLVFRIQNNDSVTVKAAALLIFFAGNLVFPVSTDFAFWKEGITEYESLYNYIQIKKDDDRTTLLTHVEVGEQSVHMDADVLTDNYYDFGLAAPYFVKSPAAERILILGLGAGTFAGQCRKIWPDCIIDGVEIDPYVVELGQQYFSLNDSNTRIHVQDARTYLKQSKKKYDLVFLDVFRDVTIPFHLSSSEFFMMIRKILSPGGTLFVNFNLPSDGTDSLRNRLGQTIKSVFPKVWQYELENITNTVFFAGENDHSLSLLRFWSFSQKLTVDQLIVSKKLLRGIREIKKSDFAFTDDLSSVEKLSQRVTNKLVQESIHEIDDLLNEIL
jgi:spermidine synthase